MIDTDKYEGHTPAPWKTGGYNVQAIQVWTVDGLDETQNWIQVPMADRLLAVDAPLILQALIDERAEVERLRERLIRAYDWAENAVNGNDSAMMDYTEYVCGGEEE
tara:strand:- start:58 stop:375 length:318 start_codon:yes stop_codon:yes gene_type:complete